MSVSRSYLLGVALGAALFLPTAQAQLSDYPMGELLNLCFEGANDARWGEDEEIKCEQYLRGFSDALLVTGQVEQENVCLPPPGNRDDELRMAYMLWGKSHYDQRDIPAGEAVMAMLKASFACQE